MVFFLKKNDKSVFGKTKFKMKGINKLRFGSFIVTSSLQ